MALYDHLTQGQLDDLLRKLGYQLSETENGPRVWTNSEFDAVMLLPVIPAERPARRHHLMTLRRISVEKGIIESEKFDDLVEQVRQRGHQTIPSHSAA